jgi:hypothetical protein
MKGYPMRRACSFWKEDTMITRFIRFPANFVVPTLLILGFLFGPATPVQAYSTILYVAPGAACIGTPNCYATVQEAVDVAAPGIEIWVAAGTYTGVHDRPRIDVSTTGSVTQVVYITKTVTIRGGYNASFTIHDPAVLVTTLDAQNLGRVIYISGDISPTIEGLNITGGNATGQGGYEYPATLYDSGGGVYIFTASATLMENQIFENSSPYVGGGVFLGYSASLLQNNSIHNNHVTSGGGGGGIYLYNADATLSGNKIMSNTSIGNGGGLYLFGSDASLTGNAISGNSTTFYGGGVEIASCSPTLTANFIGSNTANLRGGGLVLWYSNSSLTNNAIVDNQAFLGSGLWIGGSTTQLLHNTIARNNGGGSDGIGVFVTNDGGGVNSTITLTNTILVDQTIGVDVTAGNTATLDGILWFDNATNSDGAGTVIVTNPFAGDPAFDSDSYHLTAASAAIDRGVSAGVTTDIDGQPRSAIPDLGADEYWAPGALKYIFLPLISR